MYYHKFLTLFGKNMHESPPPYFVHEESCFMMTMESSYRTCLPRRRLLRYTADLKISVMIKVVIYHLYVATFCSFFFEMANYLYFD